MFYFFEGTTFCFVLKRVFDYLYCVSFVPAKCLFEVICECVEYIGMVHEQNASRAFAPQQQEQGRRLDVDDGVKRRPDCGWPMHDLRNGGWFSVWPECIWSEICAPQCVSMLRMTSKKIHRMLCDFQSGNGKGLKSEMKMHRGIDAQGFASLIKVYSSFSCVTSIILKHSQVDFYAADILAKSLCMCSFLRSMDVSNNRLTFHGAHCIVHALRAHSGLEVLDLSNNDIQFLGRIYGLKPHGGIVGQLREMTSLKQLSLAGNGLRTGCGQCIEGLALMPSLQSLDLSDNPLTAGPLKIADMRCIHSICTIMSRTKSIHTLNLDKIHLGNEGFRVFSRQLPSFSTLTSLSVCENNIQDKGLSVFCEHMQGNTLLRSLDLSQNFQSFATMDLICPLLKCVQIQKLSLRGARMCDCDGHGLFRDLHAFNHLTSLDLEDNLLMQSDYIISGMRNATNIQVLNLSRNLILVSTSVQNLEEAWMFDPVSGHRNTRRLRDLLL